MRGEVDAKRTFTSFDISPAAPRIAQKEHMPTQEEKTSAASRRDAIGDASSMKGPLYLARHLACVLPEALPAAAQKRARSGELTQSD